MQYKPSLPENNDNISPIHPLKEFATLLAGMMSFLLIIYIILGFLVDFAVNRVSPELEAELFNHTPIHLLTSKPDHPDPRQQKIQQLTDELRQCVGIEVPITVHVQESENINAMAVPGGHIIVLSGLLDAIDTENGLSFVLGHELGHFKNRDHLKGLGRGIVLMVLATTISGPNSSLTRLVTPTVQLSQARYSQQRETKADSTGLRALNCYYRHVGGATEFFESMAQTQDDSIVSHYFGSHPKMQDRISAIRKEARENNWEFLNTIPLKH